jgi:tRNA(Arg) A34 adenosine deaminase TadA
MKHPNEKFMNICILKAKQAAQFGQYAAGSLIVHKSGEILSTQHSKLIDTPDPTAHSEIVAIREAARKRNSRYLEGCYLYTTLEPCPMCTAAAIWAKMQGIVFGASQEDALSFAEKHKVPIATRKRQPSHTTKTFSWRQIYIPSKYLIAQGSPKLELHAGFMRDECAALFDLNTA